MPTEESAPKPRSGATWLPSSWGCGALVSAGLVFLLVLPAGAAEASEGRQAEPRRPTGLRPLGDGTSPNGAAVTNQASSPRPPGEEAAGARPGAPSQIEPGVLDVQAWDWLQQDLERLIDQTKARTRNRLSPEAFEAKFIGATVEFLEIDAGTTKTFQSAVNKALDEIAGARDEMLRRKAKLEPDLDETDAMLESRAGWEEYGKAQRHAVRHPLAVLEARARHQLLREKMLEWLLRLDYGMGAATR